MTELKAAKAWGCPSPGHFDALPTDEKLDMLALYEVEWRMEAVDAHEARPKVKPSRRRR